MSRDEQALILGRVTLELKEARQELGALQAKIAALARALTDAGQAINVLFVPIDTMSRDQIAEAIGKIPEASFAIETLRAIGEAEKRVADLERQLANMG